MATPLHRIAPGSTVGIISCSNGLRCADAPLVEEVCAALSSIGLGVFLSPCLYRLDPTPHSGPPQQRAAALMDLYDNPLISAIFDISGGDAANGLLPHLDFQRIARADKPFFALSDGSVLLNAIAAGGGRTTYHFWVRTLAGPHAPAQLARFERQFITGTEPFSSFEYRFLRGTHRSGPVVGGNLRCFCKLAGTRWMPRCEGALLLLESFGGTAARVGSYLDQLQHCGVFDAVAGVILGTFTELEQREGVPTVEQMVLQLTAKRALGVVKSAAIGHGMDGCCIPLGAVLTLG